MSKSIAYGFAAIAIALQWDVAHVPGEDGLFLQPEEATSINDALAGGQKAAADLVTANETIEQLNAEIKTMTTATEASSELSVTQANRIAELEAEVVLLGGKSSGNGTVLAVAEDTVAEQGAKKLTLLDAEHPLNVAAKRVVDAKKKK